MKDKVYFDNTATSWPKPDCVAGSMINFMNNIGANPGRSGHKLSIKASRIVYDTREIIAQMFGASDPVQVVFTNNVTDALNLALWGICRAQDHIITSSMEHNSIMRPLRALEKKGIELTVVPCSREGELDPADIKKSIKSNTKMIALLHSSNVTGTIMPITEIGQIARSAKLVFLVDSAQTAGAIPIDMEKNKIDLLGFTGHKALYGPTGTGGLVIGGRVDISEFHPIKMGGTGSLSDEEEQPSFLPDKFESGTLNTVGLSGLKASLLWLLEKGIDNIKHKKEELTNYLVEELCSLPEVTVYGTRKACKMTSTVSFNIKGILPSDAAFKLDKDFNIYCRVGLHCAPAAHKTIGTFPQGTIRFGLGFFNTKKQINYAVSALKKIIKNKRQWI